MRIIQNGLGVLAALVFIAASAAMNWTFLSGHGKTPLEAHIFGAVSVAADVLKALLPFYIASAWVNRRLLHAGLGSAMFVLLLAFALFSALGFAAGNRGAVTGSQEALNARHAAVTAELAEIDTRITKIGDIQDTQIVEAALARHRQDARWMSSKACEEATAAKSREYCAEYFRLKGALAAASAGKLLIERQGELRRQLARLRDAGAGKDADPQAKLLSVLVSKVIPAADTSTMQVVLAVLIAVLVELGAAFGLYLATGHGPRRPAQAPSRDTSPAVTVLEPDPVPRPPRPRRARPADSEASERETAVLAPAAKPVAEIEGPERFRLKEARALLAAQG
jgi:hypothetical protein